MKYASQVNYELGPNQGMMIGISNIEIKKILYNMKKKTLSKHMETTKVWVLMGQLELTA